jgi:hypothetical protein
LCGDECGADDDDQNGVEKLAGEVLYQFHFEILRVGVSSLECGRLAPLCYR